MNIQLIKVLEKDKATLWNLLQFALYDGSFYVDNDINEQGVFEYKWFDTYFEDDTRFAYFIKKENHIVGFVMINGNLKTSHVGNAQAIAEFLILPQYRKHHIGKTVAHRIFDMFDGDWEVQPMENNIGAYQFWNKVIKEYSNNNYQIQTIENEEDIFLFQSKKK